MYLYYILCAAAAGHLATNFVAVNAAPQGDDPNPLEQPSKATLVPPQLQTSEPNANGGVLASYPISEEHLASLRQLLENFHAKHGQPAVNPGSNTSDQSHGEELGPTQHPAGDKSPVMLLSELDGGAADPNDFDQAPLFAQQEESLSSGASTPSRLFEDIDDPSFAFLDACAQFESDYVGLNYYPLLRGPAEQSTRARLKTMIGEYFSNIIVQVNQFKYGQELPYTFPSNAYGTIGQSIGVGSLETAMKSIEYIFFVYWDARARDFRLAFGHSPLGPKNIDCSAISEALSRTGHMAQMFSLPFVLGARQMEMAITEAFQDNSNYERTKTFFTDKWQDFLLQAVQAHWSQA